MKACIYNEMKNKYLMKIERKKKKKIENESNKNWRIKI